MQLGITTFTTDRAMNPVELAREAEARGFFSFYVPEHTHIPTSRQSPAPSGEEELPEDYKRTLDPIVLLAACASATSRILLGTGVSLVAQHDPIVLAKQIATLDLLAPGRFVFGVGFGWNREEMASHRVEFRSRRALVREKILAVKTIWTEERASFHGKRVGFEELWSWPKPSVLPPILIGGQAGPKLFRHVAEYGDGWIPIGGAGVAAALPELRRAVEQAGRDPHEIRVVPFGSIPNRGKLDYYASLGIDEVVLRIPSGSRDVMLGALDEYAPMISR